MKKNTIHLQENGRIIIQDEQIGDRGYSPDEVFEGKNILYGNVEDADEFNLGDGH